MSIDVHTGSSPATLRDIPVTINDEFDQDESWLETTVTVIAATVTVFFVSFVAVVMALA